MFPYAEAFRAIEASLKREAAKHLPLVTVEQELAQYRFDGKRMARSTDRSVP